MGIRDEHLTWVVDQLSELGPVAVRRMFGGAGLYFDGRFFGLVDDDVVYFKVGEDNRLDYVERGMEAFRPGAGEASMRYFEVPGDVLEDQAELAEWARKALAAAQAPAGRKPAAKARPKARVKSSPAASKRSRR